MIKNPFLLWNCQRHRPLPLFLFFIFALWNNFSPSSRLVIFDSCTLPHLVNFTSLCLFLPVCSQYCYLLILLPILPVSPSPVHFIYFQGNTPLKNLQWLVFLFVCFCLVFDLQVFFIYMCICIQQLFFACGVMRKYLRLQLRLSRTPSISCYPFKLPKV